MFVTDKKYLKSISQIRKLLQDTYGLARIIKKSNILKTPYQNAPQKVINFINLKLPSMI